MDTSQYLDLFIDETKEHLQSLNEHVLILEKEPENKDTINEIFRAAHTLKGMSGTMGFVRMQRLTHDLENVFSEIRNGNMKVNEKLIDVLFRGLDALESYLAVISSEGNEGTEDNEDIINDLNALLEEQSGDGAAAPAQKEVKKEETPAKEEKAENKQESASDEKCKFKQIPISEYEVTAINSARAEGKNVYGFTLYLQKHCILKSARAFLVFKSVENKGELIKSVPSTEQIEDEEFDFDFSWIFASSDTKENIKKLVMNVSEITEVYIDDIEIPDAPAAGPSNDVNPAQEKKEKLDEIMLKHIIEEVDRQVAAYQAAECGEPVDPGDRERVESAKVPIPGILIDAPLLFEAGLADRCDRILLVTADLDARIRRVCARDQVSEQAVRDRISCQMSEEEKKKRSDLIVDNSGTREELEKQLKSLLFSDPF